MSIFNILATVSPETVKYTLIALGTMFVLVVGATVVSLVVRPKRKKPEDKIKDAAPEPKEQEAASEEAEAPAEQPAEEQVIEEAPAEEPAVEEEPEQKPEAVAEAPQPQPEVVKEVKPKAVKQLMPVKMENLTVISESEDCDTLHAYDRLNETFIIIKYNRSFTAKLIQSDATPKEYYSELKNEILSYPKTRCRMSWKRESFYAGKDLVARFRIRGKTLCVYFPLEAADYEDTKYKVEDVSDVAYNEGATCLYRIKNDRRLKYAKELIATVMEGLGREKGEEQTVNYVKQYPYEKTEPLIERNLIKVLTEEDAQSGTMFPSAEIRQEIKVAEAQALIEDEVAATFVEESIRISDRTHTSIINIDTLSKYFENGEKVTLEEIKSRVPNFDKKATFVKVLARGELNKRLFVEADDFSLDAVKMIVITGGKVIRTKRA